MNNVSMLAQSLLNRIQGVFVAPQPTRLFDDAFAPGVAQLSLPPKTRRAFEKIVKGMDEVCKACQSQRLNLKNSPPFILDILPETFQMLTQIFKLEPEILKDNVYLRVFFENLLLKCKAVLKLFRNNAIYEEQSQERRKLTKYSLIFSHMLSELKSEFPNGIFVGSRFRITKKEAADFWKKSFNDRTLVTWDEFQQELESAHPMGQLETLALRETIDLTGNSHVSNFEFDVFTRLFYPWKSLLRNWQLLTTSHPGYVAFLTYDEVKKMLERLHNKPGSYVFRLSCTRLGQWAIGYVAPDGKIYQTIPQNKSLIQALIEGAKEGFYLYPNGQSKDIDLSTSLEIVPADRIKVTADQHEIYCEMGTTFELCKICDDNDKNIKIEPCGHLLCQPCLTSWQESSEGGNTCPFCRYEIKGTSKVIIESFAPIHDRSATARKSTVNSRRPAPPPPRPTKEHYEVQNTSNCVPKLSPPALPAPSRESVLELSASQPSTSRPVSAQMPSVSYQTKKKLEVPVEKKPSAQLSTPPLPPRRDTIQLGDPVDLTTAPLLTAPPPPRPPKTQRRDEPVYVNLQPQVPVPVCAYVNTTAPS